MKAINSSLKYHFHSVVFTILGFRRIGITPSIKCFLARYFSGDWKILPDGYKHPIIIRGKTSDTKLFFDIIIHEEYPAPRFTPDLIIDGGANVGLFSIYYANRFPNTKILAIEPEVSNFKALERNTAAYPNVQCVQKGLWSRECKLKIKDSAAAKWSFEFEPDPAGDVEATGLNELISQSSSQAREVLVKIDIEGADRQVLAENLEWLEQIRGLYIEVHGSWRELFRALEPYEYTVSQMRENLYFNLHRRNDQPGN